MTIALVVGAIAALFSTASFAPQAIKVICSHKTQDISLWMYILTVSGFALWTTYGLMTGQWTLIACNSICLLLSGFILAVKLLSLRRRHGTSPGQLIKQDEAGQGLS